MKPEHVFIRFNANQIGLKIEASMDSKTWSNVEFQSWKSYDCPTVKAYSTCIDIERQKREYLEDIRGRGIKTTLMKEAA